MVSELTYLARKEKLQIVTKSYWSELHVNNMFCWLPSNKKLILLRFLWPTDNRKKIPLKDCVLKLWIFTQKMVCGHNAKMYVTQMSVQKDVTQTNIVMSGLLGVIETSSLNPLRLPLCLKSWSNTLWLPELISRSVFILRTFAMLSILFTTVHCFGFGFSW